MNLVEDTAQEVDVSTSIAPELGETTNEPITEDALLDAFINTLEDSPEDDEDDGEELQDAPDDEGETEEVEAEEEAEDVSEETDEGDESEEFSEDTEVLTYDDLKGYAIELGGKNYSVNDLKSMIGQAKAAEELRKSVEVEKAQLAELKDDFSKQEEVLKQRFGAIEQYRELSTYDTFIEHLQGQYKDLMEAEDANAAAEALKVKYFIEDAIAKRDQKKAEVESVYAAAQAEKLQQQRVLLEQKGYGNLLSDTQNREALTNYLREIVSPEVISEVASSADTLILAEKARRWDKLQAEKPKKKLRASKTISNRTSKPKSQVSNKPVSAEDAMAEFLKSL